MSYIDNNLLPGEKITYRTKKHLIIFLYPFVWTIVVSFSFFPNPMIKLAALFPLTIIVFYWINQFLIYYLSEFAITNIRILMREGFLYRHTNDTRLNVIANVTVNQSLLAQALNYGTVIINSFGGESDPFKEINNPGLFQKQLQSQLYQLKQDKIL